MGEQLDIFIPYGPARLLGSHVKSGMWVTFSSVDEVVLSSALFGVQVGRHSNGVDQKVTLVGGLL